MKKRVKKYILNTSSKAHDKMLLRNLFTSLLLRGHLETTRSKARSLKDFAQKAIAKYNKITDSLLKKRWHDYHILSKRYRKRIIENVERVKTNFKISVKRSRLRVGDSSMMYEVRILNFDTKDTNDE